MARTRAHRGVPYTFGRKSADLELGSEAAEETPRRVGRGARKGLTFGGITREVEELGAARVGVEDGLPAAVAHAPAAHALLGEEAGDARRVGRQEGAALV